jgi:TonB family protein
MKQLVILLITVVFLISCNEETKIEIIKNNEVEYHRDFEVNRIPAFVDTSYMKKLGDQMIEMVRQYLPTDGGKSILVPIYYEVFISEKGKVEKIKNIFKSTDPTDYMVDTTVLADPGKLDRNFAEIAAKWKFIPALKNRKAVKYVLDFRGSVIKTEGGVVFFGYKGPGGKNLFRKHVDVESYNEKKLEIGMRDINESDFFMTVEQMPEPIGGIAKIAQKVRYPEIAKRAGIEGKVFVKALIDEKGNVVGTQIIRGIGAGCDQAAMEAVMQSRFKPGRQRGEAVKVQVTIPILFKLQ